MDKAPLKEPKVHGTVQFPLAAYEWDGSGNCFLVKLHWHEETEIVYFEAGRFRVNINMKEYRIQAPAFFFPAPGDIHAIEALGSGRESAIVFDMKMLSFEYFDEVQYHVVRPMMEQSVKLPQFLRPEDCGAKRWEELEEAYRGIYRGAAQETLDARIRIKAGLYLLLALLHESGSLQYAACLPEFDTYKVANTKKILTYIHENYSGRITAADMAGQLGMNPQYFSRYFKKLLGKTPNAYLNELRVEKAAELLARTERKIIDIAMACGYDNMGYFIKRFKEQKGITPSEYRRVNSTSE